MSLLSILSHNTKDTGFVERRKKLDPRYRNPAYPTFICRRKNFFEYHNKLLQPQAIPAHQHFDKRIKMIMGVVTLILLLSFLTFGLFSISNSNPAIHQKANALLIRFLVYKNSHPHRSAGGYDRSVKILAEISQRLGKPAL